MPLVRGLSPQLTKELFQKYRSHPPSWKCCNPPECCTYVHIYWSFWLIDQVLSKERNRVYLSEILVSVDSITKKSQSAWETVFFLKIPALSVDSKSYINVLSPIWYEQFVLLLCQAQNNPTWAWADLDQTLTNLGPVFESLLFVSHSPLQNPPHIPYIECHF